MCGSPFDADPEQLTVSGLVVEHIGLPAGGQRPWHQHDRPSLLVVYGGAIEESERAADGSQTATRRRAGELMLRLGPVHHQIRAADASARLLALEFDARLVADLRRLGIDDCDGRLTTSSSRAIPLARRLETARLAPGVGARLEVAGLAHQLLALAATCAPAAADPAPTWLHAIRQRLSEERPGRPRLDELARDAGVPVGRMSRLFRKHYGVSVGTFVRQAKVEYATQLLAGTTRSLSEIALDAGFCDQSHFTNTFRTETGLTPSEFRRRA